MCWDEGLFNGPHPSPGHHMESSTLHEQVNHEIKEAASWNRAQKPMRTIFVSRHGQALWVKSQPDHVSNDLMAVYFKVYCGNKSWQKLYILVTHKY